MGTNIVDAKTACLNNCFKWWQMSSQGSESASPERVCHLFKMDSRQRHSGMTEEPVLYESAN